LDATLANEQFFCGDHRQVGNPFSIWNERFRLAIAHLKGLTPMKMKSRWPTTMASCALVWFLSTTAAAEEATRAPSARGPLGGRGTVVLDRLVGVWSAPASVGLGAIGLGVGPFSAGYATTDILSGSGQRTEVKTASLQIDPSIDVFVSERVSVGGAASFGIFDSKQAGDLASPVSHSRRQLAVSPRVGYVFPISRTVAFWPRLSLGYSHERMAFAYSPASRQNAVAAGLHAGLVVGLTEHLLLTAGPRVSVRHSWGDGGGAAFVIPADVASSSGTSVQATAYGSLSYAF
jgi:hypothetical protein